MSNPLALEEPGSSGDVDPRLLQDRIREVEAENEKLRVMQADVLHAASQFTSEPVTSWIQALGAFVSAINSATYRAEAAEAEIERLRSGRS